MGLVLCGWCGVVLVWVVRIWGLFRGGFVVLLVTVGAGVVCCLL